MWSGAELDREDPKLTREGDQEQGRVPPRAAAALAPSPVLFLEYTDPCASGNPVACCLRRMGTHRS
jgi:hypothetical protein